MADEQQGGGGLFGRIVEQASKITESISDSVNNNGIGAQAASVIGEAVGGIAGAATLDAEYDVSEAPDAGAVVDGATQALSEYEAEEVAPFEESSRGQTSNALHTIGQAVQQAANATQQAANTAAQTIETGHAAAVVDEQAEAEVEVMTDDREQAEAAAQRKKEEAQEAAADREARDKEFQEQQQERHEAEMERIEAEAKEREEAIEAEADDEDDGEDDPYSE